MAVAPPLLFAEYAAASAEVRAIMDTQFKLIKTNARAQAHGVWYEWRAKVTQGMKAGLQRHLDGLERDTAVLARLSAAIDEPYVQASQRNSQLKDRLHALQARQQEMLDTDHAAVQACEAKMQKCVAETQACEQQNSKVQTELEQASSLLQQSQSRLEKLQAEISRAEQQAVQDREIDAGTLADSRTRLQQLQKATGLTFESARLGVLRFKMPGRFTLVVNGDGNTVAVEPEAESDRAQCPAVCRAWNSHALAVLNDMLQTRNQRPIVERVS